MPPYKIHDKVKFEWVTGNPNKQVVYGKIVAFNSSGTRVFVEEEYTYGDSRKTRHHLVNIEDLIPQAVFIPGTSSQSDIEVAKNATSMSQEQAPSPPKEGESPQ